MNKFNAKATTNLRQERDNKMSVKNESESASSGPDGGELEADEERAVEEPKEGIGAPKGAYGGFEFDLVGHPEASPPHHFPTSPFDSGSRMGERKTTLSSKILTAIEVLNNKNGSLVHAIVKYMNSNGHEVTDERRFSLKVRQSLKQSITNGQVEHVKRSFKLTKNNKNKRRSR